MTEPVAGEGLWYWSEADPRASALIGGLGGGMAELPVPIAEAAKQGFGIDYDTLHEASWGRIPEIAVLNGSDPDGPTVAQILVDHLSECEPEDRDAIVQEIGCLAGDGSSTIELARQAKEQLVGEDRYQAIPSLKRLSSLALDRVAMMGSYETFFARPGDQTESKAFKDTILGRSKNHASA